MRGVGNGVVREDPDQEGTRRSRARPPLVRSRCSPVGASPAPEALPGANGKLAFTSARDGIQADCRTP
jgi:hypothetical protein